MLSRYGTTFVSVMKSIKAVYAIKYEISYGTLMGKEYSWKGFAVCTYQQNPDFVIYTKLNCEIYKSIGYNFNVIINNIWQKIFIKYNKL